MAKQVPMDIVGAQRLAKSGFELLESIKNDDEIYMGVNLKSHLEKMKRYLEPVLKDMIIEVDKEVPIIKLNE